MNVWDLLELLLFFSLFPYKKINEENRQTTKNSCCYGKGPSLLASRYTYIFTFKEESERLVRALEVQLFKLVAHLSG